MYSILNYTWGIFIFYNDFKQYYSSGKVTGSASWSSYTLNDVAPGHYIMKYVAYGVAGDIRIGTSGGAGAFKYARLQSTSDIAILVDFVDITTTQDLTVYLMGNNGSVYNVILSLRRYKQ